MRVRASSRKSVKARWFLFTPERCSLAHVSSCVGSSFVGRGVVEMVMVVVVVGAEGDLWQGRKGAEGEEEKKVR